MADKPDETPDPANQSPDTLDDDLPTVGGIADAVVEKLRGAGLLAAPAPAAEGTPPPAAGTPDPPAAAPTTPPPTTNTVSGGESVEATVRRVLGERDTENRIKTVEEKVNKPPEPKPARTGLAAALFGKDRS